MGKGRRKRGPKNGDGGLTSAADNSQDAAQSSHGSAPAHHERPVFFNAETSSVSTSSYSKDKTGATFYGERSFSPIPKSTSREPCRYFQCGYCRYGRECRFQHSEGPSTPPRYSVPNACSQQPPFPASNPFNPPTRAPNPSNPPPKASSAPFNPIPKALTKKERAPEECLDWYLTGFCPRYRTCRYAHPKSVPPSIMKEEEIFGNRKTSVKGYGNSDFFGNFGFGGGIFGDDDDDDEMGQRMRNGGFTDDDIYELSLQGIKPWDPEAGAALAVLKGWDMDDGFGYDGYDDDDYY